MRQLHPWLVLLGLAGTSWAQSGWVAEDVEIPAEAKSSARFSKLHPHGKNALVLAGGREDVVWVTDGLKLKPVRWADGAPLKAVGLNVVISGDPAYVTLYASRELKADAELIEIRNGTAVRLKNPSALKFWMAEKVDAGGPAPYLTLQDDWRLARVVEGELRPVLLPDGRIASKVLGQIRVYGDGTADYRADFKSAPLQLKDGTLAPWPALPTPDGWKPERAPLIYRARDHAILVGPGPKEAPLTSRIWVVRDGKAAWIRDEAGKPLGAFTLNVWITDEGSWLSHYGPDPKHPETSRFLLFRLDGEIARPVPWLAPETPTYVMADLHPGVLLLWSFVRDPGKPKPKEDDEEEEYEDPRLFLRRLTARGVVPVHLSNGRPITRANRFETLSRGSRVFFSFAEDPEDEKEGVWGELTEGTARAVPLPPAALPRHTRVRHVHPASGEVLLEIHPDLEREDRGALKHLPTIAVLDDSRLHWPKAASGEPLSAIQPAGDVFYALPGPNTHSLVRLRRILRDTPEKAFAEIAKAAAAKNQEALFDLHTPADRRDLEASMARIKMKLSRPALAKDLQKFAGDLRIAPAAVLTMEPRELLIRSWTFLAESDPKDFDGRFGAFVRGAPLSSKVEGDVAVLRLKVGEEEKDVEVAREGGLWYFSTGPERRPGLERTAVMNLRRIEEAQQEHREKESAYWAKDLAGLADHLPPALAEAKKTAADGYFFDVLKSYREKGASIAYDDGKGRNPKRFGLVAWPANYPREGRATFLYSETGHVWAKDTGGRPVEELPEDPAMQGWKPVP